MFRLYSIIIGYFIGCFQSAYFVSRAMNVDLTKHGSGNLGSTNATRVLGRKAGLITFICDVLKAIIGFVLCYNVFGSSLIAGGYAGLGVILGHDFPFYLKFKGGKGVASTIGIAVCYLFTINPVIPLGAGAIGIFMLFYKGYVSLGSMCFVSFLPIFALVFGAPKETVLLSLAIAVITVYKHRSNIERLMNKTESKIRIHKK